MAVVTLAITVKAEPYSPHHHGCLLQCRTEFHNDCNTISTIYGSDDYTLPTRTYSKCMWNCYQIYYRKQNSCDCGLSCFNLQHTPISPAWVVRNDWWKIFHCIEECSDKCDIN